MMVILCVITVIAGCGGGGGISTSVHQPVTIKNLMVKDLEYDANSNMLYASVSQDGASVVGQVVAINPTTGLVVRSVNVPGRPKKIALSDNGQVLYVAYWNTVYRVDPVSMTIESQFSIGEDSYGELGVEDMEVMPGNPDLVAVTRKTIHPANAPLAVFDNGVQLPVTSGIHDYCNVLEFATTGDHFLYTKDIDTTEAGLRRMEVTDDGIQMIDMVEDIDGWDIEYEDGCIYTSSGKIIDASDLAVLADYPGGGYVAPDAANKRVYYAIVGGGRGLSITAYNTDTNQLVGEIAIPMQQDQVNCIVKWGNDGLAIGTAMGKLVLIDSFSQELARQTVN